MSQSCYYPDGTITSEQTPCNESEDHSACCRPGDACLSNGYCFGANDAGPNLMTRGGCTDSSFKDQNCPYYCRDAFSQGNAIMFPVTFGDQTTFCCSPFNGTACWATTRGSNQPFVVQNGNFITNRSTGEARPLNSTSAPNPGGPSTVTVTSTATGPATLSPDSGYTSAAVQAKSISAHDAAIGAGVGIPLGALLLVAIILLLLQTRRRKQQEQLFIQERESLLSRLNSTSLKSLDSKDWRPQHAELASTTPVAELHAPTLSR